MPRARPPPRRDKLLWAARRRARCPARRRARCPARRTRLRPVRRAAAARHRHSQRRRDAFSVPAPGQVSRMMVISRGVAAVMRNRTDSLCSHVLLQLCQASGVGLHGTFGKLEMLIFE